MKRIQVIVGRHKDDFKIIILRLLGVRCTSGIVVKFGKNWSKVLTRFAPEKKTRTKNQRNSQQSFSTTTKQKQKSDNGVENDWTRMVGVRKKER
jgi:hypothetical protein